MIEMPVIKSADGVVINIGAWDYCRVENDAGDMVETNPLPEGAYEDVAEVVKTEDGGFRVADTAAIVAEFEEAIQKIVDDTARSKQFRDGVTLASYTASTNAVWKAQAETFVAWRDHVWGHAYAELEKVLSGQRERPSVPEFLAEVSSINWP